MAFDGADTEVWKRGPLVVRLDSIAIELPYGAGLRRRATIHLEAVRQVGLSKDRRALSVATIDRTYWLSAELVGGEDRLARLFAAIHRRIDAHPNAAAIRATLRRMAALERTFLGRVPVVSFAIIGLCLTVFAVQYTLQATLPISTLWGELPSPSRFARLIALGANAPALVAEGEVFRLATANFLHAHWAHLGINLLGLWVLGPLLERIWGPWRLAAVFLISALVGAGASTWLTAPAFSIGVSTSLLGLLGAYLVLWTRFRSALPPMFVVPKDRWLGLAIINGILWYFVPAIDHWGHLGGALGGAAFALATHPGGETPDFTRPSGGATRGLAAGLVAVFAGATVWAGFAATSRPATAGLVPVVRELADRSATAANSIAWAIVTSTDASPELLRVAEELAEEATEKADDVELRAAALDTWATAHYRLGDLRRAVETSFESVLLELRPDTVSQLARFLKAYLKTDRRLHLELADAAAGAVALTLDDGQLALTGLEGLPALTVVALVERAGRLAGTLWIQTPAPGQAAFTWKVGEPGLEALRHRAAAVRIGLIATERVRDGDADVYLKYLSMDPDVRSLP